MKYREFAILFSLSAFAAAASALPAQGGQTAGQTCDEQRVYTVAAANLDVAKGTITVTAYGMASTLGWKSPLLRRLPEAGDAATASFAFVACRPAFGAEVLTPISATATIAATADAVKHVVIEARTNSQTLDVAEFQTKVHLDDPVGQE